MNDTQLTAPGILTRAADILTAQGWIQNGDYHHHRTRPAEQSPVDLATALALAAGVDMHSNAAFSPTGVHADAVMLLAAHVLDAEPAATAFGVGRWLDELTDWQDEDGRTVDEVVEKLRGAAAGQFQGLLAAIREAIDPPSAATHEGDVARDRLVARRALSVSAFLEALGEHGNVGVTVESIRRKIADLPVAYETTDDAQ